MDLNPERFLGAVKRLPFNPLRIGMGVLRMADMVYTNHDQRYVTDLVSDGLAAKADELRIPDELAARVELTQARSLIKVQAVSLCEAVWSFAPNEIIAQRRQSLIEALSLTPELDVDSLHLYPDQLALVKFTLSQQWDQ